ncbi:N-acetylmuramoyl-L-alanine amidase [Sinirhodobacter populi]|uniref:N-acetylmuramoyl-L-alanine amidase n=1 Tax=Paenirhodobacter populi TaxID=2306993 RepID=A0A443K0I2_9RHOB|nr:transporter substrate-binding protein [Sinirhodobacter populi]RWR26201.1 N-acetylmuramoyl-L-alanine amidase [Sinirhodobacter populi]
MKRRINIGLLYSRSGSYSLIADACRMGVLTAVAEVNGDQALDLTFVLTERDPGGNIDLYGPMCEEILHDGGARHVFGCVTSWSRKEVIPVLERAGGTLWYNQPYEGFEASDHVVYSHACPNQHLLPLLGWTFGRFGRRGYLTGSNYIWGWEMNRLARELIADAGGETLGERYLPIGSTEVDRMIDEIRATRPDFILNNLIGASQYRFLNAYAELGRQDKHFNPDRCPILSCNLTECELHAVGPVAEGLVAAGPYFRDAPGPAGVGRFGSSHEAAGYAAVWRLARLLAGRPGAENVPLSELLASTAAAETGIDPKTHHTVLPVLIAQAEGGSFRVVKDCGSVAGDPYLTRGRELALPAPRLRVVP